MFDRLEAWIVSHSRAAARTFIGGARIAMAIMALAAAVALLHVCTGCDSPVRANAQAATLVTELTITAGDEIDAARDRALDEVETAHPEPGPVRNAALDAEAAHWRPVGLALDAIRAAILAWTQSIALAHASGSDALLPELLRLASRVVGLYESLRVAAEELGIDDLPALPAEVRALVRALGGG